ncbi:MAG TPA: GDSL-type esterase/lipase family protein [Tepidisphaeraceae bacterium]|nr:GDSL-type esterase/lipase family protein [Tepidisphaeraceae bacterium]
MSKSISWLMILNLLAFPVFCLAAATLPPASEPTAPSPDEPPSIPVAKIGRTGPRFLKLHESFLKRAKEGNIDLLFLGDSITERWNAAKDIWQEHYAKYNPANFGISGDRTEHVLWRIDHNELDGIHPKVVVLMIGTNNVSTNNTADQIAAADKKSSPKSIRPYPKQKCSSWPSFLAATILSTRRPLPYVQRSIKSISSSPSSTTAKRPTTSTSIPNSSNPTAPSPPPP